MNKRIFNKKGATLAETLIALVIVCLVTITAISLFLASARTTQNASHKSQAQYFAEDALICFRAAEDAEQFRTAIEARGGFLEYSIEGNQYVYTLENSRFTAIALVDYPADGRASFSIRIVNEDETVITGISEFKKGA